MTPQHPVQVPPGNGNPLPAAPPAAQPAVQAAPGGAQSVGEFAWKVHAYTNDYIRFADTKAAAIIAWCSAIIAALFGAKAHQNFIHINPAITNIAWGETLLGAGSLAAFILLAAGVVCAFTAIKPRLWSREGQAGHQPGYIYWETVRAHGNPQTYTAALAAQDSAALAAHTAEHVFILGGIVSKKYYWVDWSIWAAAAGSILAALVILSL